MRKYLFITLLLNFSVLADSLPTSKEEFCSRFLPKKENQIDVKDYSLDSANLFSFKNHGGLFNGGVCWWHSRFQRNIMYLGIFKPELQRPNQLMAKELIKKIRNGNEVVIIPGFHHFDEFSNFYKNEIQQELENWQLYDGVILGSWIDGLKGDTKTEPTVLKSMIEKLYHYVENQNKIAYQKLQIKGITSHAWLVTHLKEMSSGFEIGYVDSNEPNMSQNYSYKFSDDSFFIEGYGNFVPYLEFTREEERILTSAKVYCGLQQRKFDQQREKEDYWLDINEAKINKDISL